MLKPKGKPIQYNKVVARNENHAIIELAEDGYGMVPLKHFSDRNFEEEELYAENFIDSFLKFGGGLYLCDDSAVTEEEKLVIDEYLQKCKPPRQSRLCGFHHKSLEEVITERSKRSDV